MRLLEIDDPEKLLRLKFFDILETEAKKLLPGVSSFNYHPDDSRRWYQAYSRNKNAIFSIKWFSSKLRPLNQQDKKPIIYFLPNVDFVKNEETIQNLLAVIKLLNKMEDNFPLDQNIKPFNLAISGWSNAEFVYSFTKLKESFYFNLQQVLNNMGYGEVPISTIKQMFGLS